LFSNYIDNIDKIKSKPRKREELAPDASGAGYQACVARQCGQATVVETGARKTKPQWQA
jgi:hypothetical protein